MDKKELLKYGNELTICGFVVDNANEGEFIWLSDKQPDYKLLHMKHLFPSDELLQQIIRQMDVQEIEGLQKVILRKSQRQIDQRVSWEVFRRDNFTCVYCGANDVPMTVDHIVLWEHMGDTVPDNLNCSCKKCNKTRGSMDYDEWLKSSYINKKTEKSDNSFIFTGLQMQQALLNDLKSRGDVAKTLPLRKTKRSR